MTSLSDTLVNTQTVQQPIITDNARTALATSATAPVKRVRMQDVTARPSVTFGESQAVAPPGADTLATTAGTCEETAVCPPTVDIPVTTTATAGIHPADQRHVCGGSLRKKGYPMAHHLLTKYLDPSHPPDNWTENDSQRRS